MSCFECFATIQPLRRLRCSGAFWGNDGAPCHGVGVLVGFLLLLGWLFWFAWVPVATAQKPGTRPPPELMQPSQSSDTDAVPAEAFLFLDESGTPVMMPRMTWEEIERLKNLESGIDSPSQSYVFQSLQMEGSLENGRSLWDVELQMTVDSTQGRWIAIPLGMKNFHRLEPPQVSGTDRYRMTVDGDGLGYVMWVKSDESIDLTLKMQMAARVEGPATRSVDFDLPDVPTTIRLRIDETEVTGQIVGRGDEVVQTNHLSDEQTMLVVESAGGDFALRWGSQRRSPDQSPLLEVESRIDVRWDSPQDQPSASIQMTVRSLRGVLNPFEVHLPSTAVLLGTPTIASEGSAVDVTGTIASEDGDHLQVVVPADERLQRVDLNFDLQLDNREASAASPLEFQVPEVKGALSQRGEIVVRVAEDYRLRWRSRPWVQNVLGAESGNGSSRRSYAFQFDRSSFKLPLWLSAKQRQLRLSSETEISLLNNTARLEMTIRPNGQTLEGRGLQIDMASWRFRSSSDLETGEQLDSFVSDQYREIEFNSRGGNEPAPVRIRAERTIDREQPPIAFDLPRIIETEESLLVQEASLMIHGDGRESFVLDLQNSQGIDRVTESGGEIADDATLSRFRILPPDAQTRVVGHLIEQPQRVTLASEATVKLDGDSLETIVDWTVTGQFDFEGRLPIEFVRDSGTGERGKPASSPNDEIESSQTQADQASTDNDAGDNDAGDDDAGDDDAGDGSSGGDAEPQGRQAPLQEKSTASAESNPDTTGSDAASRWTVLVDGSAAALQSLGGNRYELISDRLTSGSISVRWRHRQPIAVPPADGASEVVPMPRPAAAEVTLRGPINVSLRGDQQLELITAGSDGASELQLESLPRDPLRVRLRPRAVSIRDMSIRRVLLRTAIGPEARHEQVLATVQGGGSFEVGLPSDSENVRVEALVDQSPAEVRRRGDRLSVFVPVDSETHAVDLRVWIPMSTPSLIAPIEPALDLPVGAELIYWQIVTPGNNHVVWASPTIGRAMSWQFDRWRLYRRPIENNKTLTEWAGGAELTSLPTGNRYLYVGSDVPSFRAITVSRGLLWIVVGSLVLAVATLLTYVPRTRHPLTAVAGAVAFTGLLALAPDAAVLAGQLVVIALILVVVMISLRALVSSHPSSRVLTSTTVNRPNEPSSRSGTGAVARERSSIPATQSIAGPGSGSEVTS